MPDQSWNSWKMTTLGLLLMGATSLVTTLVLGYRSEDTSHAGTMLYSATSARKFLTTNPIDVNACNAYAEQRSLGDATAGTLPEVDKTRNHDGAYQAAYRTCMRQKGY